MSVLLIFIDGLGIGRRNSANPFFNLSGVEPLAVFEGERAEVIFDGVLVPTDACLGIEGRPQSASGQTTILTGKNVPLLLGYHKQGFPNAAMREILAEHSLFLQLEELGIEPNIFANAYTPQFFSETPRWKSATTVAVEASAMRFKTLDDLNNDRAIFHDFTNSQLRERGFDVRLRTPEEAGRILARLAAEHRFSLYEYFITDKIGHDQDMEAARRVLPELANFIRSALQNIDLSETTVMITSDHGNIEDLTTRTHTRNMVPTIVWGKQKQKLVGQIRSLADITPAIIEALRN